MLARVAFAPGTVMSDTATPTARRRGVVEHDTGTVGLQIAVVQPRRRVLQALYLLQGRAGVADVVEAGFILAGGDDPDVHPAS